MQNSAVKLDEFLDHSMFSFTFIVASTLRDGIQLYRCTDKLLNAPTTKSEIRSHLRVINLGDIMKM